MTISDDLFERAVRQAGLRRFGPRIVPQPQTPDQGAWPADVSHEPATATINLLGPRLWVTRGAFVQNKWHEPLRYPAPPVRQVQVRIYTAVMKPTEAGKEAWHQRGMVNIVLRAFNACSLVDIIRGWSELGYQVGLQVEGSFTSALQGTSDSFRFRLLHVEPIGANLLPPTPLCPEEWVNAMYCAYPVHRDLDGSLLPNPTIGIFEHAPTG